MSNVVSPKLTLVTFIILSAFYLSNCTREYIENINGVCFESEVLPIFQSNCTQSGCHNAVDKEKGYDLTNYDGIVKKGIIPGDFRNSEIYRVLIKSGGEEAMPPKPYQSLTDAQIETIALWIEQGAANTKDCNDSIACDTANITYSAAVKPILDTYCVGCHGASSPSGGISYSGYESTKITALSGQLAGSIQHTPGFSPMPQGGNPLSNCDIAIINKWILLGAKND